MRIGFATSDWANFVTPEPVIGGSGFYRIAQPAGWLAAAGHDVTLGTLMGERSSGRLGVQPIRTYTHEEIYWSPDVLVIQRWMVDDVAPAIQRAQREHGTVVVNDIDDWWLGLSPSNRAFERKENRRDDVNQGHLMRALQVSDLVTVSTPFLAEKHAAKGQRVKVLRNCIDLDRWIPKPVCDAPPVVGWVGGIPWRSGDLETMQGLMSHFLEEHHLAFHHSGYMREHGADVRQRMGLADEVDVTVMGMTQISEYPHLFDPIDIGIVPLSYRPFNEAKSCLKGMEYAAAGIPFVAAATSEYRWLERLGCGRTAKRPKDWLYHLRQLLDPQVRANDRERNLAAVRTLSLERHGGDWERAYESLLAAHATAH